MIRDKELLEAYVALVEALRDYPVGDAEDRMVHALASTLLIILRACDRLAARIEHLEKTHGTERH